MRHTKGAPIRLIPRCVITQSSGKKRVIDDAAKGGQSALTSDANKLVLCSPLRPAQHIAAAMSFLPSLDRAKSLVQDSCKIGLMPTAIASRGGRSGESQPTKSTGLLFGLPLAVTSFNSVSRFTEAVGRRLLYVLTPLLGRRSHHRLGIQQRQRMLEAAEASGTLLLGVASKLYGVLNFLEQGVYGRIGAGGLAALKDCQQERDTAITAGLQTCFNTVRALKLKPQRIVEVRPTPCARFVAASDAAEDTPGQGTGGFLLIWKDSLEVREAFEAVIAPELYRVFTPGTHKIAQLELSMVLFALINRPGRFRGRRGVFYIENLAALMALIRGRSDAPDLEHLASFLQLSSHCVHGYLGVGAQQIHWADAISRLGRDEPWYRENDFSYFQAHCPLLLWHLPLPAVIRTFEYV